VTGVKVAVQMCPFVAGLAHPPILVDVEWCFVERVYEPFGDPPISNIAK
jgi:hypothetical protein